MDLPKFEDIFKGIKFYFWLSGIPLDDRKIFLRFYLMYFLLNLTVIEEIAYFVSTTSVNILDLIDLAPCMCIGALSSLKALFLAIKKDKIVTLTKCIHILYEIAAEDKRKAKIIRKDVKMVNVLIKYYFILNAFLITVYNFSVLVFMAYHFFMYGKILYLLPYAVSVPFPKNSLPGWMFEYTHSILSGFACVLLITVSDGIFCLLASQICTNFQLISDELDNLKNGNHEILSNIVQKHQYILRLSADLEDIFTMPNLFNYLVGSIEICALVFCITIGNWSHILGYILFLLSVLFQILIMSVFGENIIRKSRGVGEAAFRCKWHGMDGETKRTILIIMIRAHKQQQLTANKFSVICYGSFTKIISTSWSYFTILKTVYRPEVNSFSSVQD